LSPRSPLYVFAFFIGLSLWLHAFAAFAAKDYDFLRPCTILRANAKIAFMEKIQTCPISGETPLEEVANFLTHGFGLVLSAVGGMILVILAMFYGDLLHIASSLIYSTALVLLYSASTYYHGCRSLPRKRILRIVDHASIYILIAGTYTPYTFGPLRGYWGWSMFSMIWCLAMIGVVLKIYYIERFRILSTIVYMGMGWFALIATLPLLDNLSKDGLFWLIAGGGFYTFGTIFFLWEKLPFSHSIWHIFVLGGSICHYCSITFIIIPKE